MSTKIDYEIFAEIDLNLTVICLVVHKEQDLARAASKLGVSRLLILKALEDLRVHFGHPLFETKGYSIQPTVIGGEVLKFLVPLASEGVQTSRHKGPQIREVRVVENLIDAFCVIEEAHKAIADCMAAAVAGQNLTTVEFRMLHVLANGVAVTPIQCSLRLNITLSRISKTIGSLEDKGFIIRRRDQSDKRLRTLEPSDLGLEAFELTQDKMYELWERESTDFGPRLRQMAKCLEKRL